MKKNILISFAFLCVMITGAFQSSYSINKSSDEEEIELYGSLYENTPRSVFSPVQAFISISRLRVNFFADLENIDVVICDASRNIVYERGVNTSEKNQITIDISDWDQGSYEIRLIDPDGNFRYGEFDIE